MADITPLGETIRAEVESQGYAVVSEFEYASDDPFEPGQVSPQDIDEAVRELGYMIFGGRITYPKEVSEPSSRNLTAKAPRKKASAPKSKRGPVEAATSKQNEHAWAMLNDRELTPAQLAVGMRIHYYAFTSSGGKCERALDTLAVHCGMSRATLKRAAQVLVERGYFIRLDNGKGAPQGRGNKATWKPSLPAWRN